jgi:hypothetical protein
MIVIDLTREATCEGVLHVEAARRRAEALTRDHDQHVAADFELQYRAALWTFERRIDQAWRVFGRAPSLPAVHLGYDLLALESDFDDTCVVLAARRRGRAPS